MFRLGEVGGRVDQLELLPVLGTGLLRGDFQLPDRPGAGPAAPRAVVRQVAVVERFELQAGDTGQVRRGYLGVKTNEVALRSCVASSEPAFKFNAVFMMG